MPHVAIYNCGYYSLLPHGTIDVSLIKVYNENPISNRLLGLTQSSVEFEKFLLDTTSIKLALVHIADDLNSTKKQLDRLIGCTQVIVKGVEFKAGVPGLIRKYDLPNFVFILNGYLNFELQHATVDQDLYWIKSTADPYIKDWSHILQNNLHSFDKKPFMFDVMYGTPKSHRVFVKKKLSTVADPTWYHETPFFVGPKPDSLPGSGFNFDQTDLWEDDMEIDPKHNYRCRYRGKEMNISQVLPLKIYNKTAYSIVMETWADNRYSFFTEKIAKPILGRRLFVVISGQHFLRNLRQLGFKTFDGIIDESYDSIYDSTTRWTKAIEQTEWLCQQPQEKILSLIAPIVIHNFAVLGNLRCSPVDEYAETFLIQNGCASKGIVHESDNR
jgi:hypothetical protein